MKSSQSQLTLENISKLLDQKLDQKLSPIEERIENLEQKQNANFAVTHEMIKLLRKEMNQRFDRNETDHQETIDTLIEFVDGIYRSVDKRVTKLEHKVLAI